MYKIHVATPNSRALSQAKQTALTQWEHFIQNGGQKYF
jgi:hypothetical protein